MKRKSLGFTILLIFILSICLCGCGGDAKDNAKSTETKDEYVDVDSVEDSDKENTDKYKEETSTKTTDSKTESKKATAQNSGGSATTSSSGKYIDQYKTEAIPEGEPAPVEPEEVKVNAAKKLTCTISIECSTILKNMADFNADKMSVLPSDGIIMAKRTVTFSEGESVFDILLRETKASKIHMEYEMTPIYNSNYIEGINNLYEFDCGELSGWMYCVNGWYPNYGCSRYQVKDGDVIEWHYTCDLGEDLGQHFDG